ncbi:MAG: hypothetical protein AUJ08_08835 [Thaumarchaeota archaeon 13_1_40CM_3_50_5]|nr:MAG: hypothetical protein AUH71_04260 [Thaumarchaeota archaeon 13_1_40CM_4_48_7]OLC79905.1 MAG: hypothetical protein AUJ08_08835 [Thaumarchaeota archaeon 13_1_40CM_3_50_5]
MPSVLLPTGKIEELLWVLEEKVSESVLDLQITGADSNLSVKEVIRKLRVGELKMDDLSADDRLW